MASSPSSSPSPPSPSPFLPPTFVGVGWKWVQECSGSALECLFRCRLEGVPLSDCPCPLPQDGPEEQQPESLPPPSDGARSGRGTMVGVREEALSVERRSALDGFFKRFGVQEEMLQAGQRPGGGLRFG